MEFYTNGTFNSPEQLRERIRNTLEMSEFQICDNLPGLLIVDLNWKIAAYRVINYESLKG